MSTDKAAQLGRLADIIQSASDRLADDLRAFFPGELALHPEPIVGCRISDAWGESVRLQRFAERLRAPETAQQSAQPAPPEGAARFKEPMREWYSDTSWKERSNVLSLGVVNRLMKTDRALQAAGHITRLLAEDGWATADARDDDEVQYTSMAPATRSMMELALIQLLETAEEMLGEVRENDGDFVRLRAVPAG